MFISIQELHLFMVSMKPYIIGACIPIGISCFVLYMMWSQTEGNK